MFLDFCVLGGMPDVVKSYIETVTEEMYIKKANACLALITILILVLHAAYQMFSYVAFVYNPVLSAAFGFSLMAAMLLHV